MIVASGLLLGHFWYGSIFLINVPVIAVDGLVAIYAYDDLVGASCPVDDPLPVLIPHPALVAPRTGYALARDEVNHVGEPVVMVVATDRYIAEDAAERIRVAYDVLAPVVGVDTARRAERAVHHDVPDNVAAHLVQGVGDIDSAMAAAPHTLELELSIERSASMPMEGKGVYARWDSADGSMRVYSSTQTSTSVRAAVAARLDLPLNKVDCIAPMVGGGFGVKIMHPWPEEVMVPWAARELDREVKWVEEREFSKYSERLKATGIIFRETKGAQYFVDWHNAPRRQFVVNLSGEVEITVSDGETRRFGTGTILLAEDVTGKGHISRGVGNSERLSIFVPLADDK